MKASATEILAAVREVRGAADELEALRVMAVFVERVEGETGADFDRTRASATATARARLLEPRYDPEKVAKAAVEEISDDLAKVLKQKREVETKQGEVPLGTQEQKDGVSG